MAKKIENRVVIKPVIPEAGFYCPMYPHLKIVLGAHFSVRRKERKVSMAEARETIRSPDLTMPCKETDHVRFVKAFGKDFVHIIGVKCDSKKFMLLKTVMVLPTGKRNDDENNG